jgi:hypothetical protein
MMERKPLLVLVAAGLLSAAGMARATGTDRESHLQGIERTGRQLAQAAAGEVRRGYDELRDALRGGVHRIDGISRRAEAAEAASPATR